MASCPRPMHAFYTGEKTATGGEKMIFTSRFQEEVKYMHHLPKGGDVEVTLVDYVEIPCGKCMICKANQAKKKGERAMAEANTWEHNEVINLTYNDENLPTNTKPDGTKVATLRYKDVQDFKKRLLKTWKEKYNATGIRFLCACEYGEKYQRPHYHLIMFNFEAQDKKFYGYTKKGSKEYGSEEIAKIWGKGNITLGEVTPETIQYVANYCLKKFKGKEAKGIYKELGVEPESVKSSNRRGLGANFIEKRVEIYKNTGKCFLGTFNGLKTIGVNKYYDQMVADIYGEDVLKQLKEERMKLASDREKTRAFISGIEIETQRQNDERIFLERIKKAKGGRQFQNTGY